MGHRLHVAKKYVVEYGEISTFNWNVREFHYLLDALDVYYSGEYLDDTFVVLKSGWATAIDKLKGFEDLPQDEQDDITDTLKPLGYSVEEILRIFEGYLKESEPNNIYLHFAFF